MVVVARSGHELAANPGKSIRQIKIQKMWSTRWVLHMLRQPVRTAHSLKLIAFITVAIRMLEPLGVMHVHVSHDNGPNSVWRILCQFHVEPPY